MATILEVMQSRLGIQEIPGQNHNPIIVGWAKDAGHPNILDDETAWCSICLCSAAVESDMPMPPVNVNTMARSWMTWGVKVELSDLQPDDIAIWPRGNPSGPYGHVNVIEKVLPSGKIICIGGNQSGLGGGDAVTRTKALDPRGAIMFRRGVPATVKDLRAAGSTTIKQADRMEKVGILTVFLSPIYKGIEILFGTPDIPKFADIPTGLSWWSTTLKVANEMASYAQQHPYLAATLICGLGLFAVSRLNKSGRVAEHAAGIPIAAEVAKLGAA